MIKCGSAARSGLVSTQVEMITTFLSLQYSPLCQHLLGLLRSASQRLLATFCFVDFARARHNCLHFARARDDCLNFARARDDCLNFAALKPGLHFSNHQDLTTHGMRSQMFGRHTYLRHLRLCRKLSYVIDLCAYCRE